MTIVAFDTLRFSRNLAEAGLAPAQADGIAAATAGALAEVVGQLATRDDLASQNLALRAEIAGLRRDLAELELRMTIKLGTMMAGAVALTAALVRLL
jgi:cell shape-determining protein MreC